MIELGHVRDHILKLIFVIDGSILSVARLCSINEFVYWKRPSSPPRGDYRKGRRLRAGT